MKRIPIISFLPLAGALFLASCFGDEPANAECDIERIWVHADAPEAMFFHPYDTLQTVPSSESAIQFQTRYDVVVGRLPLFMVVTPGADVFRMDALNGREVPFVSGDLVDFSGGQTVTFRVRSESGEYHRDYAVSVVPRTRNGGDLYFTFDDYYRLDERGNFYEWQEPNAPVSPWWSTGNPGYRLSVSSAKPLEYPTCPEEGTGVDGKNCVRLTTSDTKGFGAMVNMRIAAGNLFVGTFDVANALRNALAATQMGHPFAHKPVKMTGYYKYRPGATKQDRMGKPLTGETDYPDFYLAVYRNVDAQGNRIQMDGNILETDLQKNPHAAAMVGTARISREDIVMNASEWTKFELPVVYTVELSREDVENECYSMAVVFTSSNDGGNFSGAVGSTLWIDNVTIECEY